MRINRSVLGADIEDVPVWTSSFSVPRPSAATTTITYVYPTSGRLPENHLKFYVHFRRP